jgi:hypothetical protein
MVSLVSDFPLDAAALARAFRRCLGSVEAGPMIVEHRRLDANTLVCEVAFEPRLLRMVTISRAFFGDRSLKHLCSRTGRTSDTTTHVQKLAAGFGFAMAALVSRLWESTCRLTVKPNAVASTPDSLPPSR